MKSSLEARREELVRELERIKRWIAWTQRRMARLGNRIAALQQCRDKAA